jgi:hypothetical protein
VGGEKDGKKYAEDFSRQVQKEAQGGTLPCQLEEGCRKKNLGD